MPSGNSVCLPSPKRWGYSRFIILHFVANVKEKRKKNFLATAAAKLFAPFCKKPRFPP